jgi:type II secretory pathway pseudopilin PulG
MPPAIIGALAPVVASGVGSLIQHKQQSSAAKQQAAYEQQQAAQAEAARKAQWEGQQNSPEALMARQRYTMQLGRLAGAMGGMDKLPPSIAKTLQAARAMPAYTPGQSYIPKPTSGGGGWDIAAGAADALSYLDPSKLKGKPKVPMSPGQPTGGGGFQGFSGQFTVPQIDTTLQNPLRRP